MKQKYTRMQGIKIKVNRQGEKGSRKIASPDKKNDEFLIKLVLGLKCPQLKQFEF